MQSRSACRLSYWFGCFAVMCLHGASERHGAGATAACDISPAGGWVGLVDGFLDQAEIDGFVDQLTYLRGSDSQGACTMSAREHNCIVNASAVISRMRASVDATLGINPANPTAIII